MHTHKHTYTMKKKKTQPCPNEKCTYSRSNDKYQLLIPPDEWPE